MARVADTARRAIPVSTALATRRAGAVADGATADTGVIFASPAAGAAARGLTALPAGGRHATTSAGTIAGPVVRLLVAVVVDAVADVGCAGMDRGITVVAVLAGSIAVAVIIGLARNTFAALADLAGVGALHAFTGIVLHARPALAVPAIGADDTAAAVIDAGVVDADHAVRAPTAAWLGPVGTGVLLTSERCAAACEQPDQRGDHDNS